MVTRTWTPDELTAIAAPDELKLATRRRDGTLRDPVTIWAVRHGDELYIRSVNGPTAAWYRGAQTRHQARILAGGVEKDVTLIDAGHAIDDQINAAEDTLRRITSRAVIRIRSWSAARARLRSAAPTDANSRGRLHSRVRTCRRGAPARARLHRDLSPLARGH